MKRPRGNPRLPEQRNSDTKSATESQVEAADLFAADLLKVLYQVVVVQRIVELPEQAKWLNANGHPTRLLRDWSPRSLQQFYDRVRERGIQPSSRDGFLVTPGDISGQADVGDEKWYLR
jgi:hypothetical protein